jgi:hypothetical protein
MLDILHWLQIIMRGSTIRSDALKTSFVSIASISDMEVQL